MLIDATFFVASSASNRAFETKIDVNRFESSPKHSATANPRIGPVPNWKRNAAEISAAVAFAVASPEPDVDAFLAEVEEA